FGKVKGLLLGGVIWGVWHFPVIMIAGYEYGKEYIGAPFAGPVVFCIVTITWGIIADYVYEKTGCIWAAAIFHGSVNAFGILPMIFFEPKLADHMILGPVPVGIISIIPTLAIAAVMLLRNREEVHEKAVAVNNI
ncbi:MAG: CPBP family intramembrane metalloprotease, partial [Ruminococcus sp.]|nr:CPBP family intramembrane metalloprotease [Ruminococcus sp.]